jgi:hypothetical protein
MLNLACEEQTEEPQPETNSLVAHAGSDLEVQVNQPASLNGSLSKDTQNKPFQFAWSIKNKPMKSTSTIENPVAATASFVPDKPGVYTIELRIFNDKFESKDEVIVTATTQNQIPPVGGVVIDQDITQEFRFENKFDDPDKPDYIVTRDIHVKACITIDPKVVIAFEQDKGMYIDNPGCIKTLGWGTNPVVFTGKEKVPGYWKGLIINSSSSFNELETTIIEYAGSSVAYGMSEKANLGIDNAGQGRIILKNSTIQYGAGYGMVVEDGAFWYKASMNNAFLNNYKPLQITAYHISSVDGFSYFNNNQENIIEVTGGAVGIENEVTAWGAARSTTSWPTTVVPYLVKGKIEIFRGVRIYEGAEFIMDRDAEIQVLQNGYLIATGTDVLPVKLYGKEAEQGYWKGIAFKTGDLQNELKNVVIAHAGSAEIYGIEKKAAVGVDGDTQARLKVTRSRIEQSGGYGLFAEPNAELSEFQNNQFLENAAAGAGMAVRHVKSLTSHSATFLGNGMNGIEIYGSVLEYNGEMAWPALADDASYFITGNLDLRSGVVVLAGAKFKVASGKLIQVKGSGYLNATGSESSRIRFSGMEPVKGYWNGIIVQSASTSNFLNYVDIYHAGKDVMPGIGKVASIGVEGDSYARLIVANSKISGGNGYGIVVESGRATINDDIEIVNQYEDLTLGNVLR